MCFLFPGYTVKDARYRTYVLIIPFFWWVVYMEMEEVGLA
jgi:hypothetical protein